MAVVVGVRHMLATGKENHADAKKRLRELLDFRDTAPAPSVAPLVVASVIKLYIQD